jgi:uncharacterized membrane protein
MELLPIITSLSFKYVSYWCLLVKFYEPVVIFFLRNYLKEVYSLKEGHCLKYYKLEFGVGNLHI